MKYSQTKASRTLVVTNGDFEEEIYMARVEQMITEVQAPVSPTSAPLITTKET